MHRDHRRSLGFGSHTVILYRGRERERVSSVENCVEESRARRRHPPMTVDGWRAIVEREMRAEDRGQLMSLRQVF